MASSGWMVRRRSNRCDAGDRSCARPPLSELAGKSVSPRAETAPVAAIAMVAASPSARDQPGMGRRFGSPAPVAAAVEPAAVRPSTPGSRAPAAPYEAVRAAAPDEASLAAPDDSSLSALDRAPAAEGPAPAPTRNAPAA